MARDNLELSDKLREDGRAEIDRPTRIVTYAWGAKYVDILLSFALPALLAPGNLPAIASEVPCELVILTETKFFAKLRGDPTICRITEICPVQFVSLDDLVSTPDRYGIALTFVLHRGISDLGATMTDHWQIFLNADFIIADGSLRNLLGRLRRGVRLVAAPSYCVNAQEVLPALSERISPSELSLAISPREMARLVLDHRHQTIRGKTLNRPAFHLRYVDQFYWEVDDDTLLGHQMPIAIVGMRPERYIAEPNSYWDYGLMREFCPDAEPCIMGDSDEFLMLELRSNEVALDQIIEGPVDPKAAGERMIIWVTPYQRDFARYPLTLHSRDLTPEIITARCELAAARDEILAYCPPDLPSHIEHSQWIYHRAGFTEARHAYLSRELGNATATSAPPADYSDLDKAWWRLDGERKRAALRRAAFMRALDEDVRHLRDALNSSCWRSNPLTESNILTKLFAAGITEQPTPSTDGLPSITYYTQKFRSRNSANAALTRDYSVCVATFDAAESAALAKFEADYEQLRPKPLISANPDQAHTTAEPENRGAFSGLASTAELARRCYRRLRAIR